MSGAAPSLTTTTTSPSLTIFCRDQNSCNEMAAVVATQPHQMGVLDILDRSVPLPHDDFELSVRDLFTSLRTTTIGSTVLYGDLMPSTQELLKQLRGLKDGTVCWAARQSNGKGRGSNTWESPPGCLLFSYKCQINNPRLLPFLQYLVSLSLVKAVRGFPNCEELPLTIKWPNDLYCGKKLKIGGVLCQSTCTSNTLFDVTIGVGLNVTNTQPTTCLNDMRETSTSQPFTVGGVLGAFLTTFEQDLATFKRHGFAPFGDEYTRLWIHSDQIVDVVDGDTTRRVRVLGINPDTGYLLAGDVEEEEKGGADQEKEPIRGEASTRGGATYELHPDGHSLDFLKGLIIHKTYPKRPAM